MAVNWNQLTKELSHQGRLLHEVFSIGRRGVSSSHLCDALLKKGHEVRIFDRPNLQRFRRFEAHEEVEWLEGDFVNPHHLEEAASGCGVVYHLVSTTLPRSSNENPVYDVETNVAGTLHLLGHRAGQGKSGR